MLPILVTMYSLICSLDDEVASKVAGSGTWVLPWRFKIFMVVANMSLHAYHEL
jgi:hypothetical protein